MSMPRDPADVLVHAIGAGDRQLAELLTLMLSGRPLPRFAAARRTYEELVQLAGLAGPPSGTRRP